MGWSHHLTVRRHGRLVPADATEELDAVEERCAAASPGSDREYAAENHLVRRERSAAAGSSATRHGYRFGRRRSRRLHHGALG
jgi:hypothetical protein